MVHDRANWRSKTRRAALALTVAALPFACLDGASVYAQSIMRSPNLNIGSRIPSINSTVMPRIDPNIANLRTRPACSYAYRDSNGECSDRPVSSADGGGSGSGGSSGKNKNRNKNSGPLSKLPQTVLNSRTIAGEIVAEIDGSLSDAQADELARRHRRERIGSQNFPLIGATIGLFRIVDRRTVETVGRELTADGVRSVQANFRYVLQDQQAASTEGDPAQYALLKLRLPQAHTLAH
ncbi:MAG TPA: peptidase, partial [Bradyrhizobium sp.]|nr:peptidase [Bradyrhizobium sp.]